jgi:hypothetical protein
MHPPSVIASMEIATSLTALKRGSLICTPSGLMVAAIDLW